MNSEKGQYKNLHQDLIEKCRNQDQSSQFEIYRLYYKSLYNTTLRIVNNPAEAEDIMQEAFLQAFTKIQTYKGEVSIGAWIKKIAVNRSLDHLRSQKVTFEELNEKLEDKTEENLAPDNEENLNIQVSRIRKAIRKLPDGYRVVLSLYLLEGYDHEEISQILNISESGSRSQLVRAKKKLLELLNKKQVV